MRNTLLALTVATLAGCSANTSPSLDFFVIPVVVDGVAAVPTPAGWIILSAEGTVIGHCDPQIKVMCPFYQGTAIGRVSNRFGHIDASGKFIVEPQYLFCLPFSEGASAALFGPLNRPDIPAGAERWGFVDRNGTTVIAPEYQDAGVFSEGLARVRKGGRWGFIDIQGKPIIPCQFNDVGSFSAGLASAKTNGKWGFIDRTSQFIVEPKFTKVGDYSEGFAAAIGTDPQGREVWGFIDHQGRWAIPPQFIDVSPFKNGRAAVETRTSCGYVDSSGKVVDGFKSTLPFSEGVGRVKSADEDRSWYFIDTNYQRLDITEPSDELGYFSGGVAFVRIGDRLLLIDRGGRVLKELLVSK